MRKKVNDVSKYGNDFIMSPKNDFVFKLLFGDSKNKELLIALLSAVLILPEEEFENIQILNNELIREFKEDKKGILDIRVRTQSGNQIDIEIQILPINYMPARTLYYWGKMYTTQIKSGETFRVLKKCITINILNFECIPLEKLHTVYNIIEKDTGHIMTDLLEIHFIELPKLTNVTSNQKSCNKELLEWLEFINSKSKGEMEMLAKKNEKIKKAYEELSVISKDEKARMLYEAREAELKDQLTRMEEAEEKGIKKGRIEGIKKGKIEGEIEGIKKGKIEVAKMLIQQGAEMAFIIKVTGFTEEEIIKIGKDDK